MPPFTYLLLATCWGFSLSASAKPLHERNDRLDFELFSRQQSTVISSDGTCGSSRSGTVAVATTCLGSDEGNCCSRIGFCGRNSSYCGAGCQPSFGLCGDSKISTDGSCGGGAGLTCKGSAEGNCCSQRGFCGETAAYCGAGCQATFGDCYTNSNGSSSGTSGSGGTGTGTSGSSGTGTGTNATQVPSLGGSGQGAMSDNVGVRVGLGVGISAAVLLLCTAALLFVRRRRKRQDTVVAPMLEYNPKEDSMDDPLKTPESSAQEIDGHTMPAELSDSGGPHELPSQPFR